MVDITQFVGTQRTRTENRKWSDKFLDSIINILSLRLASKIIVPSTDKEDMEHNSDLMTLKMDSIRIACRVREYRYYVNKKYRHQFTMRCELPSGRDTEFQKMMGGWGDYYFYGFVDKEEQFICKWIIGDLGVFRDGIKDGSIFTPTDKIPNWLSDMTRFYAFSEMDMPDNFFIARSEDA